MRRTKIVCTLGPSSETKDIIKRMMAAGMDVVRLNFSHGTYEHHTMLMRHVRKVSKELGKTVAIMQDLQGPKIRFGELPDKGIKINKNEEVLFVPADMEVDEQDTKVLPVDFMELYKYVAAGQKILLADGLMDVRVVDVRKKVIKVKVINGGVVLSHKGINIPESKEVIASLTAKDVRDLEFGIKNGVDYVALSFVQTADDVKVLKRLIKKFSKKYGVDHMPSTKIITKIEKRQA
ncbi:pyruvate kinase, partial [Patescibacteria group bacterium]|nr:pyruvate kinase [Patescibacteria group bacterium]